MPQFEVIPINEAQIKSASGKRAQILREYIGFINQLDKGQAGRLEAAQGETPGAVRRRVGAAAKQCGKTIVIKRTGEYGYFWMDAGNTRQGSGAPAARNSFDR
jgi:hypothetical protein